MLTTTTPQGKSEPFSVTTAILSSATEKKSPSCSGPLSTYAFTLDLVEGVEAAGHEDVFDIQVERTENFIANGVVSHNTRWHPDDLAGKLISERGWKYLKLPAIDGTGAALWPDQYPLDRLQSIRTQVGEYTWSSLYQGEPRGRGGAVFRDCTTYKTPFSAAGMKISVGVDLAYSAKTHADYSVAVTLAEHLGVFYVLDVQRVQLQATEFAGHLAAAQKKHNPRRTLWYAAGQEMAIAQLLSKLGVHVETRTARADKFVRAQPVAAAWNAGKVMVPDEAPWADAFLAEVAGFTGVDDDHDDQVDALAAAYDALVTGTASFDGMPAVKMPARRF